MGLAQSLPCLLEILHMLLPSMQTGFPLDLLPEIERVSEWNVWAEGQLFHVYHQDLPSQEGLGQTPW